MTKSNAWKRVSKSVLCPICERPRWCCVSIDGSAVLCQRVSEGAVRRVGDAGWLHRLRGDRHLKFRKRVRSICLVVKRACALDFGPPAARFRAAVRTDALSVFADEMGLSVTSLHRLGIGWAAALELEHLGTGCRGPGCWTFSMTSSHDVVCGIRLRTLDGFKYSISGGSEGLFIPTGLSGGGQLLVCEGPTDTAAVLELGYAAVGRPSCRGGVRLLTQWVRTQRPTEVVIVADGDAPGQAGAGALANVIALHARRVRVIAPPQTIKDARAWKRAGATAADVAAVIDAAPVVQVRLASPSPIRGARHDG